ncbi:NF038122 family metalloprotease [Pleurocapsa sp. PCC 7319]|uniref:NF038122 family metalloprotease n=1 Tax=Pleurocapsa sp. PCC 7319 TaxID=118161 RepID=UPI00034DEAF5|nr:NF038122 family metalloprotease [Pleurocapsa sp. PCC 7319]
MSGIETGVDFNFSFAPGITDEQILGFEIAGEIWSQHLADSYQGKDLEINIYVEATDELLPDNVVGGAFPTIETGIKYGDIYDAIQNDVTTGIDSIVADNLLDQNKIDALVGSEVIDKNFKTHVTRANLKALGMVAGDSAELDGYIVLNNFEGSLWNYNYLGGPQEGTLDFLSMAQHEIGHVLGFISGAEHTEETVDNRITNMSTMDLFRYSTDSVELGINDLTYGQVAFFSIDGQVSTVELATGADFQVGHLAEAESEEDHDHNHALMSPSISLNERWSITGDDLLVLDAIGWDVVNPGVIDMAAIYNAAQAEAESAWVGDRRIEVEDYIFSSDAYNWGRASSTTGFWWGRASSTTGFWWGRASSTTGFWQEGYFMELESHTDSTTGETHYHTHESGVDKLWDAVETITDWLKDSWSSNSWGTNSWSSNSWGTNSWSSNSWGTNSWGTNSWSGNSWSGNSWSGNSWSSNSWK